ncbi:hypothetical protein HK098_007133 [Nowakowskiella sp. JEL0407]|nr:hypothetical protein HK098_007133 [Nowakowskiella sp. JEL0407]
MRTAVIVKEGSLKTQLYRMRQKGVCVLVGTPGRVYQVLKIMNDEDRGVGGGDEGSLGVRFGFVVLVDVDELVRAKFWKNLSREFGKAEVIVVRNMGMYLRYRGLSMSDRGDDGSQTEKNRRELKGREYDDVDFEFLSKVEKSNRCVSFLAIVKVNLECVKDTNQKRGKLFELVKIWNRENLEMKGKTNKGNSSTDGNQNLSCLRKTLIVVETEDAAKILAHTLTQKTGVQTFAMVAGDEGEGIVKLWTSNVVNFLVCAFGVVNENLSNCNQRVSEMSTVSPKSSTYISVPTDEDANEKPKTDSPPSPPHALSIGSFTLSQSDLINSSFMLLNIVSSVGIVMANKWAMQVHGFKFGTTLTMLHFVVTFVGLEICARFGMFERKQLRVKDILGLSSTFCGFVVLTNLSLQYNSVGFYQMAKVLTTPCVVVIQTLFYKMEFSREIKMALTVTCIGVVISSVTDVSINLIGTLYALAGVVVTSVYQIWVGTKQKELEANSMQLLYYQAPISAIMLLFIIPFVDNVTALQKYEFTGPATFWILISASLAFFVNISIFLVIGKTSAVTYNMVGHFKLCLIIIGGFILFGYTVDFKNLSGIFITLCGIYWYTDINLKSKR